jgi:hypothetical protein
VIISTKGISMDEDKVETVRNWNREKKTDNGMLTNLFEIEQLHRLCNYYRRFIPKYSAKVELLTGSPKKDEPFVLKAEQQLAFETMLTAFTTVLALRHFDVKREVIIEPDATDASDDVCCYTQGNLQAMLPKPVCNA